MNKVSRLCTLFVLCFSVSAHADESLDGATLYVENCASCHEQGTASPGERLAPPIVGVKDHYVRVHADREAFVSAIAQWVTEPATDRTLMPGAISRFGIMPAVSISTEMATAIAEFLYDEELTKPGWYEEHYQQEHGTGHGKSMGKDSQ